MSAMAKKVGSTLVDDFDNKSAADETVGFSLDGVNYEIDLASKNAEKLRGDMKSWVSLPAGGWGADAEAGQRAQTAFGKRSIAHKAALRNSECVDECSGSAPLCSSERHR